MNRGKCSVEGCDEPLYSEFYCLVHYIDYLKELHC